VLSRGLHDRRSRRQRDPTAAAPAAAAKAPVAPAAATAAAAPAAADAAPAAADSAGDHDCALIASSHEQQLPQETFDIFSRV